MMMMITVLTELLLDLYLLHQVKLIYRRSRSGFVRYATYSFMALSWLLLIVAVAWPSKSGEVDILPKMWLIFTWLTITGLKFIYIIFSLIGKIPVLFKHKPLRLGLYIGMPLGILFFLAFWWGALINRHNIAIERITLESARLPESFDGYSIVQISDLHLGSWGNDTTFVSNLVDSVNSLKPDLIVFTGDLVNRAAPEAKPFISVLSRLKADDGVLAILGNHDYGDYCIWENPEQKKSNLKTLREYIRLQNWRLLDNENISIKNGGDSIIVIGVGNWGEPPFKSYGDFHKALKTRTESKTDIDPKGEEFKVLLTHNPEHWRQIIRNTTNIDLTLSGHTHAMQMMVKAGGFRWSPSMYIYENWAGLYEHISEESGNLWLYVNVGDGEVGLPMRVGADPEITYITLKRPIAKAENKGK